MILQGKVTGYINGEKVFEGKNTVKAGLKAYFRDVMKAPGDQAIDALFSTADEPHGSTVEDGNDGIVCISSSRGERTMATTTLTPDNTYGKKWRGEYTNTTGGDETITYFQIGHNFNSTSDPFFEVPYGDYDPTDITLSDQDTLVLEWEIYIS